MNIRQKIMLLSGALCAAIVLATPATAGDSPFGKLGISSVSCDCSYKVDSSGHTQRWVFRAEPQILDVDHHGPADGRLEPGDFIVAIDGKLIVTGEGGRRFSAIESGEPVVVTVRREGRVLDQRITPRRSSPDDDRLDLSAIGRLNDDDMLELSAEVEKLSRMAVEMQRSAQLRLQGLEKLQGLQQLERLGELEALEGLDLNLDDLGKSLDALDLSDLKESMRELQEEMEQLKDAMPSGSFGMGLSFSGDITTDGDGEAEWNFEEPPVVTTVEFGSPAARAGIQTGDVLTKIDGVDLDSAKGGRLFSSIEPGQTVEFTYERDDSEETVSLTAVDRDDRKRSRGKFIWNINRREPAQFSMTMGNTRIEVHSDGAVRTITGDDDEVVVIETPDGTFELRRKSK